MNNLHVAIGCIAALAPIAGRCDGLSYSYWDLAYIASDIDNFDRKLDGYLIGGSIELSERVFFHASYADTSADKFGIEVSERDVGLSLGYALPLTKNFDLVGQAGYAHGRAEIEGFGDVSDDGYTLGIGARARFADAFEVEGGVQYVDFTDFGDDTAVGLGFQWYFTPQVAVSFSGSYSDDVTGYTIGLRGAWGR